MFAGNRKERQCRVNSLLNKQIVLRRGLVVPSQAVQAGGAAATAGPGGLRPVPERTLTARENHPRTSGSTSGYSCDRKQLLLSREYRRAQGQCGVN